MGAPKVGIYLRLSRDDERQGESVSIENQRALLRQYAAGRGWEILREYVDDGFSGLQFDRPGFSKMLEDIEGGAVDTVLIKDLSRLGRDQIFTAYFFQMYFPQRGVRCIAVSEGLDCLRGGAGLLFPFLTAANDFYTADISRKVRAALRARKLEGKFAGAKAPFGYQKAPGDHSKLIVREEEAVVVRQVYEIYLRLGSVAGTAKVLNAEGVPTPASFLPQGSGRAAPRWHDTTVRRILTNPTYAGHLTQNRRVKINYKLDKRRQLPAEEWITVCDTHTPIISQVWFDRTQSLLALKSHGSGTGKKEHLLAGLAFCADCGAPMTYVKGSGGESDMVCSRYRRAGGPAVCTPHRIKERWVIDCVCRELAVRAGELDRGKIHKTLGVSVGGGRGEKEREWLLRELERQKMRLSSLYEDRLSGVLEEEEFRALLAESRARRERLTERLEILDMCPAEDEQSETEKLLRFEKPDKGMMAGLVSRVRIFRDKNIEIWFAFRENS